MWELELKKDVWLEIICPTGQWKLLMEGLGMKLVINSTWIVTAVAALLFLLSLTGCGPGYHTTDINGVKKDYHIDDQGQKNLVFEVGKDGTAPVYDENDPIYVMHHPNELGKAVKKAEKHKGAVYDQIRKEFESDTVIKLIARKDGEKSSEFPIYFVISIFVVAV